MIRNFAIPSGNTNQMQKLLNYVYFVQKEISLLSGIDDLLYWDGKTHMPNGGATGRSEQLKLIEGLIHDLMLSKKTRSVVRKIKRKKLLKKDSIVVNELDKIISKEKRVPREFKKELAKKTVLAQAKWKLAKDNNNFEIFRPYLRVLVELKRKHAHYLNPKVEPYNALLNDYEEGMTTDKLEQIFNFLKPELVKLINEVKDRNFAHHKVKLGMSKKEQLNIISNFIKKIGIAEYQVALDSSIHPFSIRVSRNDVRITARYADPFQTFFDAAHEAGHALYELGLPKEYYRTLVHAQASLSLDESQAIFWENFICRSENFWKTFSNNFYQYSKQNLRWEDFYKNVNIVRPSFIRLDSDEVTYCLHIILRYEIERDLINGRLNVENIKEEWNKKMEEFFGIVPKKDNDGVLQDAHWADADFGYFPVYLIGMIYAAQIYRQINKEISEFPELVEKQEFEQITRWLREKVHEKGKTMPAEEVMRKATGQELNPKVLVDYFNNKYSKIYGYG